MGSAKFALLLIYQTLQESSTIRRLKKIKGKKMSFIHFIHLGEKINERRQNLNR